MAMGTRFLDFVYFRMCPARHPRDAGTGPR
jgi:hypothetical protein